MPVVPEPETLKNELQIREEVLEKLKNEKRRHANVCPSKRN